MAVYRKHNEKWYCRGRVKGERYHKLCDGAKTKEEASELEDALRYKIRQRQNGLIKEDLKNITLSGLVNIYLDYSRINKKSYSTDKSRMKLVLEYFKQSTLIKTIKPVEIEGFKNFLLKKDRTKATTNRYLEMLKTMFNIAISNKYLTENPMGTVKKFPIKNYSLRYLTGDEEARLFEHLSENIIGIVIVALNTGLRKSNILNLKWENINFDFGYIEILENKGNKHLKIPINPKLKTLFSKIPVQNDFIFINPETKMPYKDIKKSWNSALKKANIHNFRFHDLRHTVGTRLAQENVPLNTVKEILGHSDIHTTMRYVHQAPRSKIEAMNILANINSI